MSKINLLPPNVFNMLAAGEVVERPASVVKELIENAIDAGATSIDVAIEDGGKRKIQVADDGVGIERSDLRAAFLPHATSKIQAITDLDALSTLGFRGEALASVASISEVSMVSSYKGEAAKIVLRGGQVISETPFSRDKGTIITVENLFFNTPARLKFLKKTAGEQRAVLETVQAQALANPGISFSLSNEDGVLLSHSGGTLFDAIISVYGVSAADKLIKLSSQAGGISVNGYISSVDFTKPNRTYQTTIVNGRAVKDATIQTAVEKAYGSYLMKRAYPMYVLDVVMPFDQVDANVHPSKTEVRFADRQAVFGAVYHAVSDAIAQSMRGGAKGFDLSYGENAADLHRDNADKAELSDDNAVNNASSSDNANSDDSITYPDFGEQLRFNTTSLRRGGVNRQSAFKEGISYYGDTPAEKSKRPSQSDIYNYISSSQDDTDNFVSDNDDKDSARYQGDNNSADYQDDEIFDGRIIGQVFSTYIIVERGDILYIIDQHAAHERILYDKIVSNLTTDYTQPLLIPYKLNLTPEEEDMFEKLLPELDKMGFEIEKLSDGWYLIKAVPQPVSKINFTQFFGNLFNLAPANDGIELSELLKDDLARQACRAAIRGGETLTNRQLKLVIKNFVDQDGLLPAKCPHGRPAVIQLSKSDLEKLFKRIV